MVTTIQVQDTTKQMLDALKRKNHASSYDTLLVQVLKKRYTVDQMFGCARKKPLKFTKRDEMVFNEL